VLADADAQQPMDGRKDQLHGSAGLVGRGRGVAAGEFRHEERPARQAQRLDEASGDAQGGGHGSDRGPWGDERRDRDRDRHEGDAHDHERPPAQDQARAPGREAGQDLSGLAAQDVGVLECRRQAGERHVERDGDQDQRDADDDFGRHAVIATARRVRVSAPASMSAWATAAPETPKLAHPAVGSTPMDVDVKAASPRMKSMASRPRLDRSTILAAAFEIVEQDGLTGLTMRRLATHLGVAPMAAYRHFDDRSTLVDAMLEQAGSSLEAATPDTDTGWRDGLAGLAGGLRHGLLRYPGLIEAAVARPSLDAARPSASRTAPTGTCLPPTPTRGRSSVPCRSCSATCWASSPSRRPAAPRSRATSSRTRLPCRRRTP